MNFDTSTHSNLAPLVAEFRQSSSVMGGATLLIDMGYFKHGHASHRQSTLEYASWSAMKGRCYRQKDKSYAHYGGRGIRVCDRWKDSFENFLADMGARPSKQHTIDRINNDGNYEPSNCRWATSSDQRRNSRGASRLLTYCGKTMRLIDWSKELGIGPRTISARIKHGWDVRDVFEHPLQIDGHPHKGRRKDLGTHPRKKLTS